MNSTVVLNRYIEALMAVSRANNHDEVTVLTRIQEHIKSWTDHAQLKEYLENPLKSFEEKKKVLDLLLKNEESAIIKQFFCIFAKNKRMDQLIALEKCIQNSIQLIQKTEFVNILTVTELKSSEKKQLTQFARKFSDIDLQTSFVVDKTILGGFKLIFNDKVVDGSIEYNLKRLKTYFKGEKKDVN